jgi:hypothetical protein
LVAKGEEMSSELLDGILTPVLAILFAKRVGLLYLFVMNALLLRGSPRSPAGPVNSVVDSVAANLIFCIAANL